MTRTETRTFVIEPLGAYSLEESANFIGAWHEAPAQARATGGHLHLAFLTDRGWSPVGVCLTQGDSGTVHGEVYGSADVGAVERQVRRILSLDVDGRAWPEVGKRDRVVGMLQRTFPGFRPVLFGRKVEYLNRLGLAALAGELDTEALRALSREEALERLQRLYGIGEFGSQLIRLRALSAVDELPTREPRLMGAIRTEYGLDSEPDLATLEKMAESWRPYRMWVAVYLRRNLGGGAGMTHSRASG